MRLFRQFSYRIPKDERNAQLLFDRAREVVRAIRGDEQPIRFFTEDSITSPFSAAERASEHFPALAPFRCEVVFNGPGIFSDLPGLPALSNLPDCWEQANPNGQTGSVDPDVLSAVLAGVPKPYPFDHVTLMFDDVDWFRTGGEPSPPALLRFPWLERASRHFDEASLLLSPSIAVATHAYKKRRLIPMVATVEIETPPHDAQQLPALPQEVEDLLDRLGKRDQPHLATVMSDEELSKLREALPKAEAIVEPVQANMRGRLSGVSLPHQLPADPPEASADAPPMKAPVAAVMEPLGYHRSRESKPREEIYLKTFPNHTQARVWFSMSTFKPAVQASPAVHASFVYGGPLWGIPVFFNMTPGQERQDYDVGDEETMAKVAQNAAAIVEYLEGELIPPLDELYGPAPAWWADAYRQ